MGGDSQDNCMCEVRVTAQPITKPTASPTTTSPTAKPTATPTTESDYYVVCARGSGCPDRVNVAEANVSETYPVRCCKDEGTSGFTASNCDGLYAAFDLWFKCKLGKTYFEAKAICNDYGGRLCMKDELMRGCLKDLGCGKDKRLVWSGTPVE